MNTFPLFLMLKPEDQVKLITFQWDNYGLKLDLPIQPKQEPFANSLILTETSEEYEREMRKAPHPGGQSSG